MAQIQAFGISVIRGLAEIQGKFAHVQLPVLIASNFARGKLEKPFHIHPPHPKESCAPALRGRKKPLIVIRSTAIAGQA